jgi:hypothetical protein
MTVQFNGWFDNRRYCWRELVVDGKIFEWWSHELVDQLHEMPFGSLPDHPEVIDP